ncbi:MFS transporter [Limibacter armeniacum]|uniref:MFS transporter n=1 Tax=Limibacter armeniacum TaxID=466084 RepID=UPI002FE53B73
MNYWQLVRKHPHDTIFGLLHYLFSCCGQSFFISLFVPAWITSVNLDNAEFAKLYGMATLGGAVALSVVGPLIDRVRIKTFTLANGVLLAVCCFLLSQSQNWIMLGLSLTGIRLSAQGLMPLTGATAMGRYFEANRGKALSFATLGMSIGELMAPTLIVILLKQYDWSTVWIFISLAIITLFPISIMAFGRKEAKPNIEEKQTNKQNFKDNKAFIKRLRTSPSFLILAFMIVYTPFITAGFLINQNLIVDAMGLDLMWFAAAISSFGTCRIVTTIFTGPLVDRFTAQRIIPFTLLPLVIGMLAVLFSNHAYTLIFFMGMVGVSISFGSVAGSALWAELYGVDKMGTVKSQVSTFMVFLTALAPVLFAYMFEIWFQTTFVLLISIAIILMFASHQVISQKSKLQSI